MFVLALENIFHVEVVLAIMELVNIQTQEGKKPTYAQLYKSVFLLLAKF